MQISCKDTMNHFTHAACAGAVAALAVLLISQPAFAAGEQPAGSLSPEVIQKIDDAATEVLKKTAVPGTSIAVVRDGHIVYLHAYGSAHLEPSVPADPALRYGIGSISKQFTASALLLLQQDGKLSLDDKVAKYLPELTRAGDITIRQLLSHTSGYQDYWPQDYMFPLMVQPISPEGIMDRWARQPLDYDPGTKWQYSNTGYVIAGRIVEKASGKPLFQFLRERIFEPLNMTTARDFDREPLAPGNVSGYVAYALGPPRPAEASGAGWLFGAGELAMTAEDLARWDISVINRSLLSDASYRALETETLLINGAGTNYGLGVDVEIEKQRRKIAHGGEVNGFTALNSIYPDDRTAIVVLVNQDASRAIDQLTDKLVDIVFEQTQSMDTAKTAQARAMFDGLQQGRLDRALLAANANFYFSEQAIADFKASLGPLGTPTEFKLARTWLRGGMTGRSYDAKYADRTLRVWTYEMPDGKLEQFQVAVKE
jgi:CubicO group peptidase (beta-lactamase class C family)